MDADRRIWLDSLKAGSEVLLKGRSSRNIVKVQRLTPAQIVIDNATRFRRKDGEEVGGQSFNRRDIEPVLQEDRDAAEAERLKRRLIAFLQAYTASAGSLPLMKRLDAAITAPEPPAHPRQRF